jgi:hypothetical protein
MDFVVRLIVVVVAVGVLLLLFHVVYEGSSNI